MATQTVKEKMKITEHDALTNVTFDRDMSAIEIEQFNIDKSIEEAKLAKAEAREQARQALLDKLGITADEAKLLLG
jgi:N-acetylmuramoyl-L-alanine amidase